MLSWNDTTESQTSESCSTFVSVVTTHPFEGSRAPFRKYDAAYPFEEAGKLKIPYIAYTGNAHCSDYHGKMDETLLRVRFWYSNAFDNQLERDFLKCLRVKLDDWRRASGHKNISTFCGLVESQGWGKVPSLVVPLYEMDINQYLRHSPNTNPLTLLLNAADALAYMHSLDPPVAHGAIRGENIHIDKHGEPMLVDPGLEHLPRSYGASEDQHDRDNLRWLAPEIIDPPYEIDIETDNYDVSYDCSTPQSDVWSFGMTMLEVMTGKMPWAEYKRNPSVVYHLIQGQLPQRPQVETITDPIWKLILLCFERDPSRRISMSAVRSYLQLNLLDAHALKLSFPSINSQKP